MSNTPLYVDSAFEFIRQNNLYNVPNLYGEFTIENEHAKSLSLFQILDDDNTVQYVAEFEKDTDKVVNVVNHNGNEVARSETTKTEEREYLDIFKDYVLDVFQNFLEEKHKEAMEAANKDASATTTAA